MGGEQRESGIRRATSVSVSTGGTPACRAFGSFPWRDRRRHPTDAHDANVGVGVGLSASSSDGSGTPRVPYMAPRRPDGCEQRPAVDAAPARSRSWRRWVVVAAVALVALATSASCGATSSRGGSVADPRSSPTTSTTAASTTTTEPLSAAALELKLTTATMLPGEGWVPAGSVKVDDSPSSGATAVLPCTSLTDQYPELGGLSERLKVTGPTLKRSTPAISVQELIVQVPTSSQASAVVAAFRDPAADACVRSLVGRRPGSDARPPQSVEVTSLPTPGVGDDAAALYLTVHPRGRRWRRDLLRHRGARSRRRPGHAGGGLHQRSAPDRGSGRAGRHRQRCRSDELTARTWPLDRPSVRLSSRSSRPRSPGRR